MSDNEKENVEKEVMPQSLKDELKKESKKFLLITVGLVILVIMNICLTTTVIVLTVTRQNAPRQFPTTITNNGNDLPLLRNGNWFTT